MIEEIRVTHFKSLKEVFLSLRRRNVLVGPNMSGKSNLLDVLRLLRNMTLTPQAGMSGLSYAISALGGFSEIVWKGSESNVISIGLRGGFPLPTDSGKQSDWREWAYEISILGDPQGWLTVESEKLQLTAPDRTANLIDDSNGHRSVRNSDGATVSNLPDKKRSALEYEIPSWEGYPIRNFLRSWRFYSLIPKSMKQFNPTASADFLMENGDNLSAWLMTLQTRHQSHFAKIKAAAKDVFPQLQDLFTSPTQQATVSVSSSEKHLRRPVGVWQMSDGQLCFIALLSLIFCPEELGAGLYCIEEPENYLHPKLLETLVSLLDQVQIDLGPERSAQVVATTHSPHLIDKLNLDELIVAERRAGATHFSRPSDKRHLRDLLTREEAGLGELYYTGALSSGE